MLDHYTTGLQSTIKTAFPVITLTMLRDRGMPQGGHNSIKGFMLKNSL
jgi:hypothetical protein